MHLVEFHLQTPTGRPSYRRVVVGEQGSMDSIINAAQKKIKATSLQKKGYKFQGGDITELQ